MRGEAQLPRAREIDQQHGADYRASRGRGAERDQAVGVLGLERGTLRRQEFRNGIGLGRGRGKRQRLKREFRRRLNNLRVHQRIGREIVDLGNFGDRCRCARLRRFLHRLRDHGFDSL